MINGYYYYQTPIMNYVNHGLILSVVAAIAAVVGIILFFTFFRKKNEGKYTGRKEKLYNLMNFNRFYAEDILRFLYIVITCAVTVTGIATIILGSFLMGIFELVGVNLLLRIGFELVMMFILLCRKAASIDRKLSGIEKYYDDGYDTFCADSGAEDEENAGEEEEWDCGGDCTSCSETCDPDDIRF